MYLSRVAIDKENRKKVQDLTHLGAFHNWVERSFPEEFEENIRSRKLWRIDHLGGKDYLLILSDKEPDLTALERYGVSGTAQTKSYDSFLNSITENQTYKFRVTLNPVKSVSQGKGKRGRVVPHITVEQQMEFLESRAKNLGFELLPDEYLIVERSWEPLRKEGQRTISLSKATYEGLLKVTDKKLFCQALTEGIGKKKAYGCGFMTVIPK